MAKSDLLIQCRTYHARKSAEIPGSRWDEAVGGTNNEAHVFATLET